MIVIITRPNRDRTETVQRPYRDRTVAQTRQEAPSLALALPFTLIFDSKSSRTMDSAWLDEACRSSPAMERCRELYQKKLWHELTVELEKVVNSTDEERHGLSLHGLFNNFIRSFADKINPLSLALFAVATVKSSSVDPYEGQEFLRTISQGIAASQTSTAADEACLYLDMQIAQYYLISENLVECKELMDKGAMQLDALNEVNGTVAAALYFVTMQYHKQKSDYAAFYRAALKYLAYTPSDGLSKEFAEAVAVDVSLAALLGEDVYNFGELLVHPVVGMLNQSATHAWLYDMLGCFHQGDIDAYDSLCKANAQVLNSQPALVANERKLREKITVLCLMAFVSSLPAEKKSVSLAAIGERTKLSTDSVEFLLMKALALHLIEGVIDQVNGTVSITWIAPRVLTLPEIEDIKCRVDAWLDRVDRESASVAAQADGIF